VPGSGLYDLYGVVNHTGSLQFGHYFSYCFHEPSEAWMTFNDSTVRQMQESEVVTSAAYVLFYRRRGFQGVVSRIPTGEVDGEFEKAMLAKIQEQE
jgi:hypothetical protein